MKVILAVDGSPCSEAAVAEVAGRSWPEETEVKVLSVVEPPPGTPMTETWTLPTSYLEDWENAAEDQASNAVARAVECLKQAQGDKLAIDVSVIHGYPKEAILDEADRCGADLIVLGSHGYRGLKRLWLGSVSQAVAANAKCSVEIVRAPKIAA